MRSLRFRSMVLALLLAGCNLTAGNKVATSGPAKSPTGSGPKSATTSPTHVTPAPTSPASSPTPSGSATPSPTPTPGRELLPFTTGTSLEYTGTCSFDGLELPLAASLETEDARATDATRTESVRLTIDAGLGAWGRLLTFQQSGGWLGYQWGTFVSVLPVTMGDNKGWDIDWTQAGVGGHIVVVGKEAVTVKAGSYPDAYKLQYWDAGESKVQVTAWMVPYVGMVKAEVTALVPRFVWPLPVRFVPVQGQFELAAIAPGTVSPCPGGTPSFDQPGAAADAKGLLISPRGDVIHANGRIVATGGSQTLVAVASSPNGTPPPPPDLGSEQVTGTIQDGVFTLPHLHHGYWNLRAVVDGHSPATLDGVLWRPGDACNPDGDLAPITVVVRG